MQDSIKYHFLSLWYDLTLDRTQVSRTIGEHVHLIWCWLSPFTHWSSLKSHQKFYDCEILKVSEWEEWEVLLRHEIASGAKPTNLFRNNCVQSEKGMPIELHFLNLSRRSFASFETSIFILNLCYVPTLWLRWAVIPRISSTWHPCRLVLKNYGLFPSESFFIDPRQHLPPLLDS